MKNLLANIANAWVRGTLHALNSVLFAKYLSLALGIDAASAALLGGCASGLVIMRGRLVSTGLAAVRLFRSVGITRRQLAGRNKKRNNREARSGSGDGDIQKKFCESLGMKVWA